MLKGERTRLQRYAIESTPTRVYEGCCTWFTILVLSATIPKFTIPPEVAYTSFCRRCGGKARRKCLAFPADMLLHPVDGNKTGKVILELDVYYAISLPIKFRIFDRGVL